MLRLQHASCCHQVSFPAQGWGEQTPEACSHGGRYRSYRPQPDPKERDWDLCPIVPAPTPGLPESVSPCPVKAYQALSAHPAIMVLFQLQQPDGPPDISPGTGPRTGTEGEWPTQGHQAFLEHCCSCPGYHGHHPPYPELHPPDVKPELVGRSRRPEDAATGTDTRGGREALA